MRTSEWVKSVIRKDEIEKYLINGKCFIDERVIEGKLEANAAPDKSRVRAIIQKSLEIKTLEPDETAALLNVQDPELWEEMDAAALEVKKKVYDNRIVFFAPLYCSNLCVNNCSYCGFRVDNAKEVRRILTMDEVRRETEVVLDEGHKRMILVYGEHPRSDVDYMADTIRTVYSVERKAPITGRTVGIRRVNVNAAPMEIAKMRTLKNAGIGTYQVFQETYHRPTYESVHPANTVKGDYLWRLYSLHRAMEGGIDDVAIGALFGVYDWKFEVMSLLYHTLDLERQFGVGPHTISFPRLTPALEAEMSTDSRYKVSDDDFKKLVTVLRLSVPFPGMIVTCRENPQSKKEAIMRGCTQTDASTKIGIGAYQEHKYLQELENSQFTIGDSTSLDCNIQEMAKMGFISSFCTAGYRCGRTGDTIMGMLKHCVEGKYCKLNAVLTFREYLDDYASPETKQLGETLIRKEIAEIEAHSYFQKNQKLLSQFKVDYDRINMGERDIFI
ncbi:MAG: [FeFe] hydrogenase H-cluster radical SAM maturase HydG [Bacteroidota bacterium]|nr:[FeFe] hydrogenase H-cluster radical SAM maturase HydG [Bacteroidota bacterium]MDP4207113.1 [FeFe] hydrogenase H-cluster radical SAM maturase HydG [Bacteroidota bacterium]